MLRAEKDILIEKMSGDFQGAQHLILATFNGLSVNQDNELRKKIHEIGGDYFVIKNRLAKRAAAGTPVEKVADGFAGPCAVALHPSDPVLLAKTLSGFAKDNPQFELLSGLLEAENVLDGAGVKQLAKLPGLQELRAQLLSLFQQPAVSLVRLLNTPATQISRVLQARTEDGES